jgi:hypothetical protein
MRVICHIGQPKTATTLLQATCVANRDWLRRHGVLYPDTMDPDGNHIGLLFACANQISAFARGRGIHTPQDALDYRAKLLAHLHQQVAAAAGSADTLLFSSENLTGNISGQAGVQNLADFLSEIAGDVRIIVYLRRQDDALLSMYGEYMRRGFSDVTFPEFVANCLTDVHRVPHIFHRRILEFWVNAFGRDRITVRLFDRAEMAGGDIVTDFLGTVFDDREVDISGLVRPADANISPSAPALEFLRRIQPRVPFARDGVPNPRRSLLHEKIDALPTSPRPVMAREMSDQIMDHFAAGNDWVRATFLPGRAGPLFPPRPQGEAASNLGQLSVDDCVAFAGIMLQ